MPLIAGIEAGGTKFVVALATADGERLAQTRIATTAPAETLGAVAEFLRSASARHGAIAGIGIASFGPIIVDPDHPDHGRFTTTPKPGWPGARFHDWLGGFGAPILVDTDVNGAGLAEWLQGAGRGCKTLAYSTIGTGIGSGILKHGQPQTGILHLESGHIAMARDRQRDPFIGCCPWHGDCLEGLASGVAIQKRWGEGLDAPVCPPERTALIADYIGQLCTALVLLHMPDRLILGGGVMKAPGLIDAVRAATARRLNHYVQAPQLGGDLSDYIAAPMLGDDAGLIGALALAQRAAAR
ncbi:ROK family protein [Sandarakinorhabdus oryzae]|uniref:ROK family protein n=1 Tax=Sandarakinorhabdus oryzae TaxID=2675220 RepID=UPI0012E0EEDA|nr:ROK family protein [Sandarakinorhabdus oryzae]